MERGGQIPFKPPPIQSGPLETSLFTHKFNPAKPSAWQNFSVNVDVVELSPINLG